MNRDEHLKWAKDRALEYADRGEMANAIASLTSDLNKHPDTAGHSGVQLMYMLATGGHFSQPGSLRRYIEGFN
jgi:hypothetical protein